MVDQALFTASEWDRAEQRGFAFPGQQLASGMIRRFIDIPYFSQARRWMPAVLSIYARGRCILEGWNIAEYSLTVATLEMVAPNLPNESFLAVADARKIIIRASLAGLIRLTYDNIYTASPTVPTGDPLSGVPAVQNIIARFPAQVPEDIYAFIRVLLALPPVNGQPAPIIYAHYSLLLAEALAVFLNYLCTFSSARGRSVWCNMYTLIYVSCAKRGNITQAKLTAICNAVSAETNLTCDITAEDVKACRGVMGTIITGDNAQAIMEGLADNMTAYSLGLTLTVQQTIKAGMTSYWAIEEALRVFGTFDWATASGYIPDDFVHYGEAQALVPDNQYYGFIRDLGNARHTRYKSLAWLCIKLLVRFR
ncbi:hypothetical protein J6590_086474 [Homalodisca vitripennis]|nr:hypothetical protein J6590_086474 [Homalodisca vitripennis]